jgi:Carboxypeptidase regulatory-like domain/TonB dependent receptor
VWVRNDKTSRAVAGLILLWMAQLAAQSPTTTGSIQVVVTDSTGSFVAGVRVTASLEASGASRYAETDSGGGLRFLGLPIGKYTLRLEKEGFASVFVGPFLVSIGQTAAHRIQMDPAPVIERVEVTEAPEAVQVTATTAAVALGYDRIEEAPNRNRNYLSFVLTAPGVAPSGTAGTPRPAAGARSALPDSGFVFAGMRGRNNSLLIDGVDNRDETTGGNRVAIGLEMVQEFRVSGTAMSAEFGGAAGGVMNVVTRSGANVRHGDVTFFTQNDRLNARNPEALSATRPRFRKYQPGVSTSGPVRRDRTFFAAALEQEWESGDEWSDAPEEAVEAINTALARPEFLGAGVRHVLRGLFPTTGAGTEFSFKANHLASERHSLTARYAFSRGRGSGDVLGAENFADRSARGSSLTRDHSLVAGWIAVPGPELVSDLRIQVARRSVELTPNVRGAMLEIPGVLTLGQGYRLDADRTEDHYEAVEGLYLTRGSHQWSLGGSLHAVRASARLADRFGGVYVFPTLEDFRAGRPDVFLQAFGEARTRLLTVPAGVWLQDRWQATPGLTVEAGLRYDRQWMPGTLPASNRNFAPRLGLAWRPSEKAPLVVRLGAGLFFDRYPLAFLNHAVQKDGVQGFEQYAAGSDAQAVMEAARGGTAGQAVAGLARSHYEAAELFPGTYARKLVAGVERGFGKETTLTVEYSHIRGFHLPRLRNAALTLPPAYSLEQSARSAYQGVSVSLNRRMSKEFALLATYSGGRTRDDGSDFDEQPSDPRDVAADWALSRQHQSHRVTASALFELPVENFRPLPAWLRDGLSRITLAPILQAGSGRPLNALDATDRFRTGAYPITARPFGLSRNPFLSPGTFSLDLRMMKTLYYMKERGWIQFGVEAFNLTNHSNSVRVSPFYAVRDVRLRSYGGVVETADARQLQLFIQVEY